MGQERSAVFQDRPVLQDMPVVRGGALVVRLAQSPQDLARVLAGRMAAFPGDLGWDSFDANARHLMVLAKSDSDEGADLAGGGWGETAARGDSDADQEGALLGACRITLLTPETLWQNSYSAQFYDLTGLASKGGLSVEPGRFWLAPELPPALALDALRLIWLMLGQIVQRHEARWLLGCSSFQKADWRLHQQPLALLVQSHLGPKALAPQAEARDLTGIGPGYTGLPYSGLVGAVSDRKAALTGLPPLLRFYLSLGAWVSDHAVLDAYLDTLHVFTCVDVQTIPAARQSSLLRQR